MKRLLMLSLFLAVLTLFIGSAKSYFRDGYIITVGNDTINGQIAYRSNAKNSLSCIFKKGLEIIEYSPEQIKGFGYVKDEFFTSEIVNGRFTEVLVSGYLSLFFDGVAFYLKKGDAKPVILEEKEIETVKNGRLSIRVDNKWRRSVVSLIYDYIPDASKIVGNLFFGDISFIKLTILYNERRKSEYKDYGNSKPWSKFEYGLSVGLNRSTLIIKDDSYYVPFQLGKLSSLDPSLGFIFSMGSPRIFGNWILQPEFHLTKSDFFHSNTVAGSIQKTYYDSYIKVVKLIFPVSVKYLFTSYNNAISLQGGISYEYNAYSKAVVKSEQVFAKTVYMLPDKSIFPVKNIQYGYWGGAGYSKSFKTFRMEANIRYYFIDEMDNISTVSATLDRISFSLIFYHK